LLIEIIREMSLTMPVGPPKRRSRVTVAIPSSMISSSENPLHRSLRLSTVARAAVIFRVERILIYLETDSSEDRYLQRIAQIMLEYLATPQYLRRKVFKRSPEMKFVGALPPLRSPSHTVPSRVRDIKSGDYREGIILRKGHEVKVDVGLGVLFDLKDKHERFGEGRILVKITDPNKREAEVTSWEELPSYWCYRVEAPQLTLPSVLKSRGDSLKIATSRYGESVWQALPGLPPLLEGRRDVLIAFGSPSRGLSEILAQERIDLGQAFDLTLNTALDQGVATIRTEEAVLISLAVLSDAIK